MKTIFVVFALIASAFAVINPIYGEWEKWKHEFKPTYLTNEEHNQRFHIFAQNKRKVLELNKIYGNIPNGPRFALNQFADLTSEEFIKMLGNSTSRAFASPYQNSNKDYPAKLDWREKGVVPPVREQGSGSVWPFVSVDNMESVYTIAKGCKLPSLSVQQLLDCDSEANVEGALSYAVKNGMENDNDYPYTATVGTCKYDSSRAAYRFSKYFQVSPSDTAMVAALNDVGPVAVTVDATKWQFYSGGIFNLDCGHEFNHNALVVGYDSAIVSGKEVLYWIIKNSWGPMWGEKGYIRLIRGQDECGVNDYAYTIVA